MESNVLKQIFEENWPAFYNKHEERNRPVVVKEVAKLLGCGNPKNGFKPLVCDGCHYIRRVSYRCKGRFCTNKIIKLIIS